VNRFVVIAPCPRRHPQPDAVLLESHRGFIVKASPRLGPGSRLGGEEVHKTVDLVDRNCLDRNLICLGWPCIISALQVSSVLVHEVAAAQRQEAKHPGSNGHKHVEVSIPIAHPIERRWVVPLARHSQ
jgi:hypothetical protein